MNKFLEFASNKKTYFVAALIVGTGVAGAFGVHIPEWILILFGGSALAAHRAAIGKVMAAAQSSMAAVDDVLGIIEVATPLAESTLDKINQIHYETIKQAPLHANDVVFNQIETHETHTPVHVDMTPNQEIGKTADLNLSQVPH